MENPATLYFSTYTILYWKEALREDTYKEIILSSLEFLVINERIKLYGFVIMPNHIHLIWMIHEGYVLQNVQRDFLKFTAQQIKYKMQESNNPLLNELKVTAKDRKFQIWERNGFSFLLNNTATIIQKLNYIHLNPVREKWSLSQTPSEYRYSSARFYETEVDEFGFLSHISEVL